MSAGMRYPMDNEKIEVLFHVLGLSSEEQELLYDLAGKEQNKYLQTSLST
jgi:hypothetical protein